ncbi:helix-turn-helix domain-containing protein [Spongiimicrobium salis]|uniref:helix-turn-helix domain-containing protein n=1 Tax=Spongiimicrobium salis TaxID=1667022 RepID=UPI00374D0745
MIAINKVKTTKLPILDGTELKSATFVDKSFPFHFHQSWSLAYIEYGSENIAFNDINFLVHKNAIQLIPPYSIHKNWSDTQNAWTYKALYISNDVVKYIAQKIGVDYSYLASFPYFISYRDHGFSLTEASIFKIIETLFLDTLNGTEPAHLNGYTNQAFDDILRYMSVNYNRSIRLETLQKEFKIDKFKLQKSFKKCMGLTPLEYLTALRIENSKALFHTNTPLVEIALESGFYDQSHFTHSFKKYVGVTPGSYKKNCKILQDW